MFQLVFLLSMIVAAFSMPMLREAAKNGTELKTGMTISSDEIIWRAQDWVNRRVPYSQSDYTDGYRQDCSGYVSMAWASSQPGHTTYNMQEICHPISRWELQPGDAILNTQNHVLLFHYWVNNDQFYQYAEIDWVSCATLYHFTLF